MIKNKFDYYVYGNIALIIVHLFMIGYILTYATSEY